MGRKAITFSDLIDRIELDGECWQWVGEINADGYGIAQYQRKTRLVHRVFYKHFIADIPSTVQLDHLCRNRSCVHPLHLEPVSGVTNTRRGLATKLTAEQVVDIRREYAASTTTQRALAAKHGVHVMTISDVLRGAAWVLEIDSTPPEYNGRQRLAVASTKLNQSDVTNIVKMHASGMTKTAIARLFSVHPSHVGRIINGKFCNSSFSQIEVSNDDCNGSAGSELANHAG